jgi:transcriptional regulator with XRE-family HTH domain
LPFCHVRLSAPKPLNPRYPKELKTLGDQLRKRRLDRGLLQREVAERLGVNEATVHNWEIGKTEPALRLIPRIIDFLGYAPYAPGTSLPSKLSSIRRLLGLSRTRMAYLLGVDESSLASWERGEHRPTAASLQVLDRLFKAELY